jgi:RNA polymerase sigma-70 factor (ECF subfamily)
MDTTRFVQACIVRLNRGDEAERKASRDDLITAASGRLRHMAGQMLRDYPNVAVESGDLLAEAYLRLERALQAPGVLERMQTAADFFRLAACQIRRELLDLATAAQRRLVTLADEATSATGPRRADPAHGPATLARRAEFFRAIDQLPEEERTAFELIWVQGLTKVEAAAALGVSEAAIRRRLLKAQTRLYDLFDGEPPI